MAGVLLTPAILAMITCLLVGVVRRCGLTPAARGVESTWFERMKLRSDEPISNFPFNFKLRCYSVGGYYVFRRMTAEPAVGR